ncbi:hypothetical protein [Cupriavidus gilardii]|uniref:hypothetical protein n=1 Tax=Cupriavidus gilardii TaxID=82541 RepID=UPI0021B492B4|nr:hypothetical protein [Cupriavidus gilardii]UXC37364.1 hypothetical protein N4G38_07980 [Cupriavidus gilardii]
MYSAVMPYAHDFEFPQQPVYDRIPDGPCYRCSKPRIYTEYAYRVWYLKYECPIEELCPALVTCEHFSREPGVD